MPNNRYDILKKTQEKNYKIITYFFNDKVLVKLIL